MNQWSQEDVTCLVLLSIYNQTRKKANKQRKFEFCIDMRERLEFGFRVKYTRQVGFVFSVIRQPL